MAERPFIRKGDSTDHGGIVISGDATFIIDGKEVARVGDSVSCPRCKGVFPIVTGAHNFISGTQVARHGDVTACGATLLASQSTATWGDEAGGSSSMSAASVSSMPVLPSSDDDDEPRAIRFQAVHPETGQPLSKRPYVLTRENGVQHGGLTDAQGYTKPIETTATEQIAVHFMFADIDGKTIDRKDLLP